VNVQQRKEAVTLRSGMRGVALLFGFLALAMGGCGSLSHGAKSQSALLASPTLPASQPVEVDDRRPAPAPTAAALPAEAPDADRGPAAADAPATGAVAAISALADPAASAQPAADATRPATPGAEPVAVAQAAAPLLGPVVAQARSSDLGVDAPIEEYDPWEPFNEKMFTFNYNFDKYALKPAAKAYNFVMPDMFQQMIGRGFDNINPVPKLVNNLLQKNWKGFGVELSRFLINSTLGIGGLFDIAKTEFGLEKTKVDFGQTLGKWGITPGPYLVLPFLPPLTVRDGIGYAVDGAMDPLSYVLPFIWDRLGMKIGDTLNDRSLNLDLFQGFEETTVDLYSAVRNGYLQRRYNMIYGGGG